MTCGGFFDIFRRRSKTVESDFDPRFGAADISSPNEGAYTNAGNPHSPANFVPPKVIPPYEKVVIPKRVVTTTGPGHHSELETNKSATISSSPRSVQTKFSSGSSSGQPSPQYLPSGPKASLSYRKPTVLPVHAAYIATPGQNIELISPMTTSGFSTHSGFSTQSTSPEGSPVPPTNFTGASPKQGFSFLPERLRNKRTESLMKKQNLTVQPSNEKVLDYSPENRHSVEQWPGSY